MIRIENAPPAYEKLIARIISRLPPYFIRAANIARIIITRKPAEVGEVAQYEHGSRNLYLIPGVPYEALRRSLTHEFAHGVDDNFGSLHYWGESPEWIMRHRAFRRDDVPPVESFAEMVMQYMVDPVRLRRAMPSVAAFVVGALSYLEEQFG